MKKDKTRSKDWMRKCFDWCIFLWVFSLGLEMFQTESIRVFTICLVGFWFTTWWWNKWSEKWFDEYFTKWSKREKEEKKIFYGED